MTAISITPPVAVRFHGGEIDNLSICQTVLLLVQKVKQAIIQAFSYCCTGIKNICCCLRQRSISLAQPKALTEAQREIQVKAIVSEVSQRGKQEHVFLTTRFDLLPFGSICKLPQRIGCGTPSANRDYEQVQTQCRQVLFETLPFGFQNSLDTLVSADRVLILGTALDRVTKEYKNRVRQLESDLFQHFFQAGMSKRLKFKSNELDETARATLQQNLSQPLEQRLKCFAPIIQEALFNSSYCQLKQAATGKGDIIYC